MKNGGGEFLHSVDRAVFFAREYAIDIAAGYVGCLSDLALGHLKLCLPPADLARVSPLAYAHVIPSGLPFRGYAPRPCTPLTLGSCMNSRVRPIFAKASLPNRAVAQVVKFGVSLRGVAVLRRKWSRRYDFANTAVLYVVDIPRNDDVPGHFGRTA